MKINASKSKGIVNQIKLRLPAISANESVCRSVVGVFVSQLNPTIEELADIKCAVSEAVTNCIVHAYGNEVGAVYISVCLYSDNTVKIEIRDTGCGIPDVRQAMQPLYTTAAGSERSGMGFAVMETFTDSVRVSSKVGKGTRVILKKRLSDTVI